MLNNLIIDQVIKRKKIGNNYIIVLAKLITIDIDDVYNYEIMVYERFLVKYFSESFEYELKEIWYVPTVFEGLLSFNCLLKKYG